LKLQYIKANASGVLGCILSLRIIVCQHAPDSKHAKKYLWKNMPLTTSALKQKEMQFNWEMGGEVAPYLGEPPL
jgi:hypothetical protein